MTDQTNDPRVPLFANRLTETCAAFLKLGCLSFGGPVAHLGYFRTEFVERRRWLDDDAYADLVALCQFLPGPASSQVAFGLGLGRAGLAGALGAALCFTLPSAVLMTAFAYGVAAAGDVADAGWLHGLKLAAVAVVAQAVWGMGKTLCPDRARQSIAAAATAAALLSGGAVTQLGVIVVGGTIGWLLYRARVPRTAAVPPASGRPAHVAAATALAIFFGLLLLLPLAAGRGGQGVALFDAFYRAGALVFGGGHVVLPLLREELVPRGWLTDGQFIAGYGAVQAVPGPLFTFAGYLGATITGGRFAWAGGLWCLLAVFLPSWLLVGGTIPFWHRVRGKAWMQAALRGTNAAVVGLLAAALYRPVITEAVHDAPDAAAAVLAFAALQLWRLPPWAVVIAMAGAGQWVLR